MENLSQQQKTICQIFWPDEKDLAVLSKGERSQLWIKELFKRESAGVLSGIRFMIPSPYSTNRSEVAHIESDGEIPFDLDISHGRMIIFLDKENYRNSPLIFLPTMTHEHAGSKESVTIPFDSLRAIIFQCAHAAA